MGDAIHIQKAVNAGHIEIAQQFNNIYDTDGKKDSCLEDLYVTDPVADKQRIEDDKGGLLKDCYSWILENDNFIQWRDDPHSRLLWVKGDPGKGKTMLLAGLITELENRLPCGVFYFFCQAAQPLLRTASYVLRGLIWFMVRKRPALISYVRKEYDKAGKSIFSNHNAWQAVSGILTAILEDDGSADCIIIIDALDECTQEREKLISYISQISVYCKAKWVISSRNWPEIESQLDTAQRQVRLHLELNHASISNAVAKYVNWKVTQLNSTFNEPTRARIREHLLDNANDTFLWVALVCQELGKPGVKHYHSSGIIQRFPAGLNELYQRMISDINDTDMEWCKAILAVIAVALRPLNLQELAAADRALIQWVEDRKTLESLVKSCGSLLTITGDKVYTVHQSVSDFLRTTPRILPSGASLQHYSIFDCSMNVMRDRLYRNLYKFKDSGVLIGEVKALPRAPLTVVGYACVYWIDHFCEWSLTNNQHQSNLCCTMITHFFENKYLYWLEAMSLLSCTSQAIKAMRRLEDMLTDRGSVKLKLLVQDAMQFASTHGIIMSAAPLQIYESALIFTPQLSKIRRCFKQETNKSIDVSSPEFERWNACLLTIPGIASYLAKCEFSPDGRQIATINRNKDSILVIDASTGGLIKSIESPRGHLHAFTFHPSGDSLATLSGETEDETELAMFHLPSGECSKTFTFRESGKSKFLSFSPNGELLAIASGGRTVNIWDTASETTIDSCHSMSNSFVRYTAWIHTDLHPLAFLILGEHDISIWGLDTSHQMSHSMLLEGIGYPLAATVSRDRTCCVVYERFRELVVYSWGSSITVQKIARFDRYKSVSDVSWLADDRSIALCGKSVIEIWDLEAKRLVVQVRCDDAKAVCYGRNRQLASLGSRDETLKIWSLDTILSHSGPISQQSASRIEAFITSSSGKVAAISHNAQSDMLSMAVNGRSHQLPKTPSNSPPGSYYRTESLELGHDDYFAVATNGGTIDVFNLEHDTGLYYCERRIEEDVDPGGLPFNHWTIEFWGQEQIIIFGNHINFWDLKTGKFLRAVSLPSGYTARRSNIITDGRIALGKGSSEVVVWDIICGKAAQRFDLHVLRLDFTVALNLSLASSGILAISAWGEDKYFIAIGNANDGSWIRKYSLPNDVPTLNFLTPKLRLDTGFGVLAYDIKHGSPKDINIQTVAAEDYWDPRCLRLSYSESEAWLMRGSRRILWIPREDINPERFSIQTDLETGIATVTLVHNRCLFISSIKIDCI